MSDTKVVPKDYAAGVRDGIEAAAKVCESYAVEINGKTYAGGAMYGVNGKTLAETLRALPAAQVTEPSKPAEQRSDQYETEGYALGMDVLQSDLYAKLNDKARAECDEFIQRGMKPTTSAQSDGERLAGAITALKQLQEVVPPKDWKQYAQDVLDLDAALRAASTGGAK